MTPMAAITFRLPALPPIGPCVLLAWHKDEGEAFDDGEVLAEIEADKALMEWRAPMPGVLVERCVEEGAALVSEAPIAIVDDRRGDGPAVTEEVASLLYERFGPRPG